MRQNAEPILALAEFKRLISAIKYQELMPDPFDSKFLGRWNNTTGIHSQIQDRRGSELYAVCLTVYELTGRPAVGSGNKNRTRHPRAAVQENQGHQLRVSDA